MTPSDGSKRANGAESTHTSYKTSGVDVKGAESSIRELAKWIDRTFDLSPSRPALPLGYYANVIPLSADIALAISTDGVGTKILVAEEMDRYDTIGIDCVAMNANDIVCVGATPVALVDYVAVERAEPDFLGQIGKGLYEGARQAGISIPGGELAQVREMIRGKRPDRGFDLVGTCVGTLHPGRIVVGEHVAPGDAIVALPSSGIHSNGFTLARRVLFETAKLDIEHRAADLGRTLGEELLTPTHMYVREAVDLLASVNVKALAHITGDGLLNVARVKNRCVGFVFDELLEVPPIFSMIQRLGNIAPTEMFLVFNMGIGFCIVVAPEEADRVIEIVGRHGRRAAVVGYTVRDEERRVWIPQHGIEGSRGEFRRADAAAPANPRS